MKIEPSLPRCHQTLSNWKHNDKCCFAKNNHYQCDSCAQKIDSRAISYYDGNAIEGFN